MAITIALRTRSWRSLRCPFVAKELPAHFLSPTLERHGVPLLTHIVPTAYHHWIPLAIKTAARSFGVAIAWRLQVLASAVHLALRGGLMCARGLLRYARGKGLAHQLKHEDDTHLDEYLGHAIAACGFYAQFSLGFGLPFPLNVVFVPLDVVEWYIRYTITSSAPPA